jgi:Skp family chaperone for outer membrane proteins
MCGPAGRACKNPSPSEHGVKRRLSEATEPSRTPLTDRDESPPRRYAQIEGSVSKVNLLNRIRLHVLVLVATALLVPAAAQAQEAGSFDEGYKIAVVNRKEVFDNYEKQKQEYAKLEQQMEQDQQSIDALSERIESMREDYEERRAAMSDEERDRTQTELDSLMLEYKTEFEKLQGDIDAKHRRLLMRMMEDINEMVTQIGREENYHLILEGDPKAGSGVLFAADAIDITKAVTDRLNAAS